jgi:ribosome biogenesis GTPase A
LRIALSQYLQIHLAKFMLTLHLPTELTESEVAAKDEEARSLRVLIAGMPNVGKSSILNALRRVGVNKGTSMSVISSMIDSEGHN